MGMNAAHWHLLTNHIPLFTILFGTMALIWYQRTRQPAALKILVGLFLIGTATAIVAVQTGEGAEDAAKKLPDVTHALVHEHEEAAEFAQIAAIILGVLSLGAAWLAFRHSPHLNKFLWLFIVISIWANSVLMRTAWLGGLIRHTEIR
jgi:hypothetical protein